MTPSEIPPKISNYSKQNYVANGIAYDPVEDFYYITGKNWAYIFKIKIYPDY